MSASSAVTIADLRRLAERRLPRMVFDYIDGGADAEVTLRENARVFDDVTFRPRCALHSGEWVSKTSTMSVSARACHPEHQRSRAGPKRSP